MENRWKEIWSRHDADITGTENLKTLVMELKRANGFDVVGEDGVSFESWMRHIQTTMAMLGTEVNSLYEVGCGSGANLVMYRSLGIQKIGGADYSEKLSAAAAKAIGCEDIACCEAVNFPIRPVYDAVISDSVTQYLPSLDYADEMFSRMVDKAGKVIAILDIHDAEKREEWLLHRRAVIEDYDAKYSGLDDTKLFINKDYFRTFAEKHGLRLVFTDTEIENYWNGQYTYNVFMFK